MNAIQRHTLTFGRLSMFARTVGRGNNGVNPSWMGFNYGSWLPRMRVVHIGHIAILEWRWLFFYGSFSWAGK